MTDIEVALDWTPNTNHLGVYVAAAEGYYEDRGLSVRVRSPAEDDYETTPAKRVANGESTLAVAPSESAISYNTHPDYPSLTAVAAVCQRDTSAIVALEDSDVSRPADMDGRTYASYGARFEDDIVRQLVRNDGGEGDVEILTPPKLGIPNTLVEGDADTTWVFLAWEGVLCEREGIGLRPFSLDEYDVPYGYTPVLLATPETVENEADALSDFLDATGKGYRDAVADPEAAARTLGTVASGPHLDDEDFLIESTEYLVEARAFLDGGEWGRMNHERWTDFVDWLATAGVLTDLDGDHIPASELDVDDLYTDDLLDTTA